MRPKGQGSLIGWGKEFGLPFKLGLGGKVLKEGEIGEFGPGKVWVILLLGLATFGKKGGGN